MSEGTELGEDWRAWKEDKKTKNKERLKDNTEDILALKDMMFEVEKLTEYQYRINKTLDLYPVHRKFHNIKTGKRGTYGKLLPLLEKHLIR